MRSFWNCWPHSSYSYFRFRVFMKWRTLFTDISSQTYTFSRFVPQVLKSNIQGPVLTIFTKWKCVIFICKISIATQTIRFHVTYSHEIGKDQVSSVEVFFCFFSVLHNMWLSPGSFLRVSCSARCTQQENQNNQRC